MAHRPKEIIMCKRAILGKAVAAALLSASAVGLLGAGIATARPTTGGLRDSCTGAGGSWYMDGYHQDGRYYLLGYRCQLSGFTMVYDRNGDYIGDT
jgi:hypothetical protein